MICVFTGGGGGAVTSPLQSVLSADAPLSLQAVSSLHLNELSLQQLQTSLRLLLTGALERQRRLQVPSVQLTVT